MAYKTIYSPLVIFHQAIIITDTKLSQHLNHHYMYNVEAISTDHGLTGSQCQNSRLGHLYTVGGWVGGDLSQGLFAC